MAAAERDLAENRCVLRADWTAGLRLADERARNAFQSLRGLPEVPSVGMSGEGQVESNAVQDSRHLREPAAASLPAAQQTFQVLSFAPPQ